jgi:hypothetical protein
MGNLFKNSKASTPYAGVSPGGGGGVGNRDSAEASVGGGSGDIGIATMGDVSNVDSDTMRRVTKNFIANNDIQAVRDPDLDIITHVMTHIGIKDVEALASADGSIVASACAQHFQAHKVSSARTGAVSQMRNELQKLGFAASAAGEMNDIRVRSTYDCVYSNLVLENKAVSMAQRYVEDVRTEVAKMDARSAQMPVKQVLAFYKTIVCPFIAEEEDVMNGHEDASDSGSSESDSDDDRDGSGEAITEAMLERMVEADFARQKVEREGARRKLSATLVASIRGENTGIQILEDRDQASTTITSDPIGAGEKEDVPASKTDVTIRKSKKYQRMLRRKRVQERQLEAIEIMKGTVSSWMDSKYSAADEYKQGETRGIAKLEEIKNFGFFEEDKELDGIDDLVEEVDDDDDVDAAAVAAAVVLRQNEIDKEIEVEKARQLVQEQEKERVLAEQRKIAEAAVKKMNVAQGETRTSIRLSGMLDLMATKDDGEVRDSDMSQWEVEEDTTGDFLAPPPTDTEAAGDAEQKEGAAGGNMPGESAMPSTHTFLKRRGSAVNLKRRGSAASLAAGPRDEKAAFLKSVKVPPPPVNMTVEFVGSRDMQLAWENPSTDSVRQMKVVRVESAQDGGSVEGWGGASDAAAEENFETLSDCIDKFQVQIKKKSKRRGSAAGFEQWDTVSSAIFGLSFSIENLQPATAYLVRMRSHNCKGWGKYSAVIPAIETEPAAPDIVHQPYVTHCESQSITIMWKAMNHGRPVLTSHVQFRYVSETGVADSHWQTFSQDIEESTVAVDCLDLLSTYDFRVRCQNTVGWGKWSECLRCKTSAAKPAQPFAPTSASSTATSITMVWNNPDDSGSPVTKRQLQYQETLPPHHVLHDKGWLNAFTDEVKEGSKAPKYEMILPNGDTRTFSNQFTHANLAPCSFCVYRVRVANVVGYSNWSQPSVVMASGANPPSPPAISDDCHVTSSSIGVTWTEGHDGGSAIDKYQAQYRTSGTKVQWSKPFGTVSRRCTFQALAFGCSYQFRVRAHNIEGWGPWSSSSPVVRTGLPTPPVPTVPSEVRKTSSSIHLQWRDGSNAGSGSSSSSGHSASTDLFELQCRKWNGDPHAMDWNTVSKESRYIIFCQ